jgi:ribosomal protein S18 acetylase RimI-like enzyme
MIDIKRIQKGEWETYKQLRLAALQEAPYAFTTTYEAAVERKPASWIEQTDTFSDGTDQCLLVAYIEHVAIGLCAFYRNTNTPCEGEIVQIWVAPEHRGTSVAKKLMDAMIQWARGTNTARIRLDVKKDNRRAIRFYQNYGFTVIGENHESEYVMLLVIA